MSALNCLTCNELFETSRGRSTHFCKGCRKKNHQQRVETRRRMIKEGTWDVVASRFTDEVALSFEQFADAVIKDDHLPISQDRQPVGYKTPAGSADGRSTFFKDLAADLDWLGKVAAKDKWWGENPHWSYELHDSNAVKLIKREEDVNDVREDDSRALL